MIPGGEDEAATVDKAAIFADVTKRNALRRANGLPLLDIRREYNHEVAIAKQRAFRDFCDQHAKERDTIREEVLAELRLQHGPNFGGSMGGRWMVGNLTYRRFVAYIAEKYDVHDAGGGRNSIIHGGGSKDP